MPNTVKARPAKKTRSRRTSFQHVPADADRDYVQKLSTDQDEPHLKVRALPDTRENESADTEACYVYGVASGAPPASFGKTGIGGQVTEVFTIRYQGLLAVVSRVKTSILDATRENALAHEHVVERVMNTHTIIPMSFGTIFRSEDDIGQVLKSIYASLKDVLEKMEGKIEFGLKVNWDRDKAVAKLKRENQEIRTFTSELAKKRLQSTYFARMQLGRMIEQALAERATQIVQDIYERLRPVCVASRDSRPIGDRMIMNAAFLLERKKEAEFDAIVNQISSKFKDLLTFRYSGPWPPYNFVNIRLKLERAEAT